MKAIGSKPFVAVFFLSLSLLIMPLVSIADADDEPVTVQADEETLKQYAAAGTSNEDSAIDEDDGVTSEEDNAEAEVNDDGNAETEEQRRGPPIPHLTSIYRGICLSTVDVRRLTRSCTQFCDQRQGCS